MSDQFRGDCIGAAGESPWANGMLGYYPLAERYPYELIDLATDPRNIQLVSDWRTRMIDHLSIRGERWVLNGELVIQNESQKYSPYDPRYDEYIRAEK